MAWSVSWRVLLAWCVVALLLYIFRLPSTLEIEPTPLHESDPASSSYANIDAIVYLAMNRTAVMNNIDYSIATLRKIGNWKGHIYVLTDKPACFDYLLKHHDIRILEVPSQKNLIEIKALKPNIMKYLPESLKLIMYLDADIIVTKPLHSFFETMVQDIAQVAHSKSKTKGVVADNKDKIITTDLGVDFAMFPDSKGHYVGWCSGCEKWHTGVVILPRRPAGTDACMQSWSRELLSGRYDTDQESIDAAEASGACPRPVSLSTRHFLFAKDYIGMLLSNGQSFVHLTGVERLGDQDYFYREVVTPRIYQSLEPHVSRSILKQIKTC